MLDKLLNQKLEKRRQENSFRTMHTTQQAIDFASNDYLGLARSEELYDLIRQTTATQSHVNGAGGSRLLTGHTTCAQSTEEMLAMIFKSDTTLIFNSGYAANQGVLSSIPQKGDTILYDELAHACIRDGARLSLAQRFSFRHNNLDDLEQKLKGAAGNVFIAVESVYSMDGDICPLKDLIPLAEKYHAIVILDEAHSTGVFGTGGAGLAVALGLEDRVPIRIYTFGKAMGVHGACVAGSGVLRDYLINFARTFIYTTALAPHSITAIKCAFEFLASHSDLQNTLASRVAFFTASADKHSIHRIKSQTQIQGVVVPGNQSVKKLANSLAMAGMDVRPILPPTVAHGSERVRICLHCYNSEKEISELVEALSNIGR